MIKLSALEQGIKVLRDFHIVEAGNGTGKEVTRNFTALVEGGRQIGDPFCVVWQRIEFHSI